MHTEAVREMSSICHTNQSFTQFYSGKQSGAYTVRYLFVIWSLF